MDGRALRTGRRPGRRDTRADILTAARLAGTLPGSGTMLGERVVCSFVEFWDTAGLREASFRGLLLLALTNPTAAHALRDYLTRTVGAALTRVLGEPFPERRVGLIGSQLLGIAVARYVIGLEPVASATPRRLGAELGWLIQQLLVQPDHTRQGSGSRR